MRLISRDRETTGERNGTSHKSIRKRQDKKSKQAHNLAHPSGCNIGMKYFDLLLDKHIASC